MRYLQILIGLMMLCCTLSVLAIQTSEAELEQLEQLFEQQTLDMVLHESKGDLDKHLEGLGTIQSIWLKHQWIRKLSVLSQPSLEQQRWLDNQLGSNEFLTIASSEHPNRQLVVINIAQQAKASLQHWHINQQIALFQQQWGTTEWEWHDIVSSPTDIVQKAFSQWIKTANQTQVEQVAESYLSRNDDLSQQSNRFLALLAENAKSAELYSRLWRKTADEYSFQALTKLPTVLEESAVVPQIIQANKNKKLQSQALFLLAKRYSHNAEAQQTLLAALDDSEAKWLTVAVLHKITDRNFLDNLHKKLSQQKPSSFRKYALKNIAQATEHEVLQ